MKKLIIAFLLLITLPALALTPDQIAQQQLIIQQQQEQTRQAEEQRRELREAERIRETRDPSEIHSVNAGKITDAGVDCPKFSTIEVLGNKIYSNTSIHKITDKYIGWCITRDSMNALQNDLTALYIDHKYTLARVYFDQKRSKLTNGDSEVVFIIEEGIVNKEVAISCLPRKHSIGNTKTTNIHVDTNVDNM